MEVTEDSAVKDFLEILEVWGSRHGTLSLLLQTLLGRTSAQFKRRYSYEYFFFVALT